MVKHKRPYLLSLIARGASTEDGRLGKLSECVQMERAIWVCSLIDSGFHSFILYSEMCSEGIKCTLMGGCIFSLNKDKGLPAVLIQVA